MARNRIEKAQTSAPNVRIESEEKGLDMAAFDRENEIKAESQKEETANQETTVTAGNGESTVTVDRDPNGESVMTGFAPVKEDVTDNESDGNDNADDGADDGESESGADDGEPKDTNMAIVVYGTVHGTVEDDVEDDEDDSESDDPFADVALDTESCFKAMLLAFKALSNLDGVALLKTMYHMDGKKAVYNDALVGKLWKHYMANPAKCVASYFADVDHVALFKASPYTYVDGTVTTLGALLQQANAILAHIESRVTENGKVRLNRDDNYYTIKNRGTSSSGSAASGGSESTSKTRTVIKDKDTKANAVLLDCIARGITELRVPLGDDVRWVELQKEDVNGKPVVRFKWINGTLNAKGQSMNNVPAFDIKGANDAFVGCLNPSSGSYGWAARIGYKIKANGKEKMHSVNDMIMDMFGE